MVINGIKSCVHEEGTGDECVNVLELSKFACLRRGGNSYEGLDIMRLSLFWVNLQYFTQVMGHVCEDCPGCGSALRRFALDVGKC